MAVVRLSRSQGSLKAWQEQEGSPVYSSFVLSVQIRVIIVCVDSGLRLLCRFGSSFSILIPRSDVMTASVTPYGIQRTSFYNGRLQAGNIYGCWILYGSVMFSTYPRPANQDQAAQIRAHLNCAAAGPHSCRYHPQPFHLP